MRKSKKPKGDRENAALDRPFDPAVWSAAERLVADYQFILWREDGEWHGRGLEMPMVFGGGATPAAAVEDVLEALTAMVAHLLERGEAPPPAARNGARTEQVNVRLSVQEKLTLEASAKHQGFKGLSDFVRAAAVERAR